VSTEWVPVAKSLNYGNRKHYYCVFINAAIGPHFMHKIADVGPYVPLVLTFGEGQTFGILTNTVAHDIMNESGIRCSDGTAGLLEME